MRKILSIILSFTVIFSIGTISVSAKEYDLETIKEETYYSEDLGGTFVRYIEGCTVIVKWIPENIDEDPFVITNRDGVIKLNGNVLMSFDDTNMEFDKSETLLAGTDIKWGEWHTFNQKVETGGVPVAAVAGIISAAAPWLGVSVIAAAIAGVASSEYYTLSGKLRHGSDDRYDYYERYTNLQTDSGTYILKDHFDSGKTRLQ